ncbi:MAG TPA: PKD domain-containing protein [Bacteroidia bacterium]|nr:PKD domain-containing protein [Bacteroidia bacterium]HNU34254.1 PKD domain-containing protein [Bacteroidia bacterium]
MKTLILKTVNKSTRKKFLSTIIFIFLINAIAFESKAQCTVDVQLPAVQYVCNPCPWQIIPVASGGSSPYTFIWSTGVTVPNISVCSIGTYTLTITDGNGCWDTASVELISVDSVAVTFEKVNPSCPSSCDGSVIVHGLNELYPFGGYVININGSPTPVNDTIINGYCANALEQISVYILGCSTVWDEMISFEAPSCFCDSFAPPNCINTCEGNITNYTAPFHNGSTWQWVVTGALNYSVNNNNIAVIWADDSTNNSYGTIKYIETKANGDLDSLELCYNIGDAPVVSFTTSPAAINGVVDICASAALTFNNLTTGASKHLWDFGNGNTSNAASPSFSFSQTGLYKVSYTASNGCQCAAYDSVMVNVKYSPGPDIQCASVVCANDTATYNTSVVCSNYNWSVTGGTIISSQPYGNAIVVVWGNGSSGKGSVTLDVGSCTGLCATPTTIYVPIVSPSSNISGDGMVCHRALKTYTVPAIPGTTFTWSISPAGASIVSGQGTNSILVNWAVPGNYTITVNYTFNLLGCSGSGAYNVTVAPQLYVFGLESICLNSSTTFNASILSYSGNYNWIIRDPSGNSTVATGGSNYNFNPSSAGTYSITVTPNPFAAGIACNDSVTVSINVVDVPKPVSINGETVVCPNGVNEYTATASSNDVVFEWSILGGTPSTSNGDVVSVQWNATGPYKVSVRQVQMQTLQCGSDTISLNVTPYTMPLVSGPLNVCANAQSNYSLQGNIKPDAYYEWSVTPTLGSVISGQGTSSIVIEWLNAAGNATVSVVALNCNNQTASLPNIQVHFPTNPTFTPSAPSFCEGSFVTVTASASFSNFLWTDSAGITIGNAQTVNIPYGGNFMLTANDVNGCEADTSFYVTENPTPDVSISTPDANVFCLPLPVNATIYALTNGTYTYQWYQNNAAITNAISATYNATQPGSYYVIISNNFNCTKASNAILFSQSTCNPGTCITNESIDFTFSACDPIQFTGIPSSASVISPTWIFDDPLSGNNSAAGFNVSHDFSSAGYYRVSIFAQAPNISPPPPFCTIGQQHVVTVYANADFKFVESCSGTATQFTDLSTWLPVYNITSWQWNFGDGTANSNQQSPSHIYTNPGTYTVTLSIVAAGCTTVISKQINIPGINVNASYSPLALCQGTPINFTAGAITNAIVEDWLWSYGDGTTSANQNPSKTYTADGIMQVTVTATDMAGCAATDTFSININTTSAPSTISPPGPINSCGTVNVNLAAPTGIAWFWNNQQSTQNITAQSSGNYNVVVTTVNNCKYITPGVIIKVTPKPKAQIISGKHYICYPDNLMLQCYAEAGCTYQWFKVGTPIAISNFTTLGVAYANATGQYYVVATNISNGCTDTSELFDVTTPILNADISTQPSGVNCEGSNVTITVTTPVLGNTYTWTDGTIQNYIGGSSPSITVSAAGNYFVTVADTFGCSLKSSPVELSRGPDFGNMITGCYEFCDTSNVVLQAPSGLYNSIKWLQLTPTGWIVVSSSSSFTLLSDGVYALALTTIDGCTDTSEVLSINQFHCCNLNAIATATMPLCFGDTTGTATVVSPTGAGVQYYWSTGATTQTITGLKPGTVYVTVQTGPYCKDNVPVQIISPAPVPVPFVTHVADTMYSSVTDPVFNYQWYNYGQLMPGANATQYVNSDSGCYTVIISDPNGCSETSDTLCVYTAMEQLQNGQSSFVIYPNPFEEFITIESAISKSSVIQIFDVTGRMITERKIAGKTLINTIKLAPAVYTFIITDDKAIRIRGKILKHK